MESATGSHSPPSSPIKEATFDAHNETLENESSDACYKTQNAFDNPSTVEVLQNVYAPSSAPILSVFQAAESALSSSNGIPATFSGNASSVDTNQLNSNGDEYDSHSVVNYNLLDNNSHENSRQQDSDERLNTPAQQHFITQQNSSILSPSTSTCNSAYITSVAATPTLGLKSRQRLPPETVRAFEEVFQLNKRPQMSLISELANSHRVEVSKARVWFNNRKAKEKRIDARERHCSGDERRRSCEQSPSESSPIPNCHSSQLHGGAGSPNPHSTSSAIASNVSSANANSSLSSGSRRFSAPAISSACHLLTTENNVKFSIDELPPQFNADVFYAMRDRILQLEHHISEVSASTAVVAAAAAAAAVRNGAVSGGFKRIGGDNYSPADAKRFKDRPALMQSIMSRIVSNLQIEALKRKFMTLDDVLEIQVRDQLCAEDFVEFFDEKGGQPLVLPGEKLPSGETLCPMISVNFCERAVGTLFGNAVTRIPAVAMVDSEELAVVCQVRSMSVLYNRLTQMVNLSFQVTTLPCES